MSIRDRINGISYQVPSSFRARLLNGTKRHIPLGQEVDKAMEDAMEATKDIVGIYAKQLLPSIETMVRDRLEKIVRDTERHLKERLTEIRSIQKNIEVMRGPKGEQGVSGYSPIKGKDYFDGTPGKSPVKGVDYFDGEPGRTPIAGIDYPTEEQIKEFISQVPILSKEEAQKMIELAFKNIPTKTAEHIARELEKLAGLKRLDYYALKNLPDISKRKEKVRGRMGGGGDIVEVYDLSSLFDGSTKTFTVPFHRKAYKVELSDSPIHLYENRGFTVSSNKLSVTLDGSVPAPSQGSQGAFWYAL